MNHQPLSPKTQPILTKQELERNHAICTEFENEWSTDRRVSIEQLVAKSNVVNRAALTESLIRSELELREGESSTPTIEEFLSRFPDDSETVHLAFAPAQELRSSELSSQDFKAIADTSRETHLDSSRERFDSLPPSLGPFEIIEEFARGGMGVLYRARHVELDRVVALKVMRSGQLADRWELTRFQTEAQAIAALEHPNIVPIYEVGEDYGFHYFSMPFVDGENLADCIREQPIAPVRAAELTRQIAAAVEYAHQHDIIHRDLKPRNILLDRSGIAKVTDFGLAKMLNRETDHNANEDLTLTGQVVGTPAYMAPEQAAGSPTKLSDVYSIGAVLYTITTGRPPFQSATILETLRQLKESEPAEPRRLNATIPRDLETIILKCLNKNPESRYASANDLALDLQRFIEGKPILARPVSPIEHLWRWTKRKPLVAALTSVLFASLATGLAISLWFYSVASQNEKLASNNFDVSLETVKQYLTDVAANPELKEQGLETLRRKLLETAQDFYLQLQKQSNTSATQQSLVTRQRVADSYYQLALIEKELGDFEDSKSQFDQMLTAYRGISTSNPADQDCRRWIATALKGRAESNDAIAKPELAETDRVESIELMRDLFAKSHKRSDQVLLASVLTDLGLQYSSTNRAEDEKKIYGEVEEICLALQPSDSELVGQNDSATLLRVYDSLALNLQRHGEFDKAEKLFFNVIALSDKCLDRDPKDTSTIHNVARANKNLGMMYARQQKFDEAIASYEKAVRQYENLRQEHPLVLAYLDEQAVLLVNFGSMQTMRRNLNEAETLIGQAVKLQLELVAKQPSVFDYRLGLSHMYANLGQTAMQLGKLDQGLESLVKAAESAKIATKQKPNDTNVVFLNMVINNNFATVYKAQGKYAEAVVALESALESGRVLRSENKTVANVTRTMAFISHNLATNYRKLDEPEKAIEADLESKALMCELLESNPESIDYRSLMATTLGSLGQLYLDQRDYEQSEASLMEAYAIYSRLNESSKNAAFQSNLANICGNLATIANQRGLTDQALDWNTKCLDGHLADLKSRGDAAIATTKQVREAMCTAYRDRARLLITLNRIQDARQACDDGLAQGTDVQAVGIRATLARILASESDAISRERATELVLKIEEEQALDYATCIDLATALEKLKGSTQFSEAETSIRITKLLERAEVLKSETGQKPIKSKLTME